ncbi:CocE/NonD family hydrolase [Chloroflexota bacterium]
MDNPSRIAMFSKKWRTSERQYDVIAEYDVRIPLSDGITLSCDIFRPDSPGKFPGILGLHPYSNPGQTGPIKPVQVSGAAVPLVGQDTTNASLEAGDPNFFVRRGYVHIVCNVRGTGKSEGKYLSTGAREHQDGYEVIEWISKQPWCDSNVGMFGVSYFGIIQFFVASTQPPHLKCLFAPWAATNLYTDRGYRGGVPSYGFPIAISKSALTYGNCRPANLSRMELGDEGYQKAIARLLQNDDLKLDPQIADILRHPDEGVNPYVVDVIMHPDYDTYWEERTVKYDKIKVPAYIGASWGMFGLHLPGAFRSWEHLNVPKKMIIGPVEYLDRPLYQLHYESLRWFDYWLKGIDTGIMDEPPIRLFSTVTKEWKEANEWPLPETKWTPFFLHESGLLSEHEHWINEGSDSFEDSAWGRGAIKYTSPAMVENTEITGPIILNLYASSTDSDIFWIVTLWQVDPDGKETLLTKGWLRGSHRQIDEELSQPWEPIHNHRKPEPLIPNDIYEFKIPMVPISHLFKAGYRVVVKVSCTDDEPTSALEKIAAGSLRRKAPSRITVYHNATHPSHVLFPITKGNVIGTYMSKF